MRTLAATSSLDCVGAWPAAAFFRMAPHARYTGNVEVHVFGALVLYSEPGHDRVRRRGPAEKPSPRTRHNDAYLVCTMTACCVTLLTGTLFRKYENVSSASAVAKAPCN